MPPLPSTPVVVDRAGPPACGAAFDDHLDGQGGGGGGEDGALRPREIDKEDALGAFVLEKLLRGRFIGMEGMVADQGKDRGEGEKNSRVGYDASWKASGLRIGDKQKRRWDGKKNPRNSRFTPSPGTGPRIGRALKSAAIPVAKPDCALTVPALWLESPENAKHEKGSPRDSR
jgi:hypothetical protein